MSQNSSDIKSLLNQFLVQKFLTRRLLRFIDDEGILKLLESMQRFVMDEVVETLQLKLGYRLQDETRIRMVKVLIDLLHECDYLICENNSYQWNGARDLNLNLENEESKAVEASFGGMVDFFEECIGYVGNYFRGAAPLFSFNKESVSTWEKFLGNAEFNFVRSVLLKLLMFEKRDTCNILNLCYGPGFDLVQIQERLPNVRLIALDFTDNFYHQASGRLQNTHAVKWVKSGSWNGFGTPLPFGDDTIDIVFFTCADPYIPSGWREYVYRDLFRILKHGGTLGIMTHSYPDRERKYVKDTWIRRGTLCHDFSESVCEGWRGFHSAEDSMNLYKEIGYHIHAVMLNASVWRLDKL
jgi:ubiquinone/menaquinone biosynthesis C-methylase UbiE